MRRRATILFVFAVACLSAFIGLRAEILSLAGLSDDNVVESTVKEQTMSQEAENSDLFAANSPILLDVDDYARPAIGFSVKTNTMSYYQTAAYNFDLANLTKCEKYFDCADEKMFPTAGIWVGNSYYVEVSVKGMMGLVTAPMGLYKFDPETGTGEVIGENPVYGQDPTVDALTYDYSTKTAYAIVAHQTLSTIDLQNGTITPVVALSERVKTIACTYNGKIYGITDSHQFVRINKENGRLTTIGDTGLYISLDIPFCSMEFDRQNDKELYLSYANEKGISNIATIDITTGKATVLGSLPDNNLVTALSILFGFEAEIPAQITDLSVTRGEIGVLTATLSWTNPAKTYGGTQLSSISKIEIYQNGVLKGTLEGNKIASTGAKQTYDITVDKSALYEYEVVVYNKTGKSPESVSKEIFIGKDKPGKVKNITVTKKGKEVQVSWDKPETGYYEGYFDVSSLVYNITRLPDNVVIATGISALTYTDKSVTTTSNYSYRVQACNVDGEGDIDMSDYLMVGDAFAVPYYSNFDTEVGFREWTVLDTNSDGCTWYQWVMTDIQETRGEVTYVYRGGREGANDWLISPLMKLEKGEKYQIRFRVVNNSINPQELPLQLGKGLTAESQTTILKKMEFEGDETKNVKQTFEIDQTGEYAVSFHIEGAPEIAISHFSVEKILDTDAKLTYLSTPKKMSVGKASTCAVTVLNNGLSDLRKFNIQMEDKDGNVLSEVKEVVLAPSLATDETSEVDIELTPKVAGLTEVWAHIILEDDENTQNDYSYPVSIDVQPEGNQRVSITQIVGLEQDGHNPSVFTERQMVHFLYGVSTFIPSNHFHQSLYTQDNLKLEGGLITGLQFYYAFNKRNTDVDVEIYLSNTDDAQLLAWIYPESQQLVYKERVTLTPCPEGINNLYVDLQNPFVYSGRNLCLSIRTNVVGSVNEDILWFLNSDYSNLYSSRLFNGTGDLATNLGTAYPYTDWVDLDINTNNINLKGKVTSSDGKALEGIKVALTERNDLYTYTDEKGEYRFYSLDAGKYTLQLSDWTYETMTTPITVEAGKAQVIDKAMNLKTQHTIAGKVIAPQGTPAVGAMITLEGEKTLTSITDNSGMISIQVPSGTYDLSVLDPSYRSYKQTINIQNFNCDLGNIKLEDIPVEVTNFKPAYNENGSVDVTWDAPDRGQVFSYCGNKFYAALTSTFPETSTGREAFMTVYHTPAILNTVSWVISKKNDSSVDLVDFSIFDMDEAGRPTAKVLYSAKNVKCKFDEWSVYTLPEWINAPNGFALAVMMKDNLSIGLDDGRDFTREANFMCYDYNISYYNSDVVNVGLYYNYLISATGVLLEDYNNPIQKIAAHTPLSSDLSEKIQPIAFESLRANVMPSFKVEVSQKASAELVAPQLGTTNATYKVWRLLKGAELSPAKWTLLTPDAISETKINDADFASAAKGTYRYAIKAYYPMDLVSDNILSKDYVVSGNKLSVNVEPVAECEGAVVRLSNFKNSYTGVVDANGKAEIKNVLEGIYDLQVVLSGFETYSKSNIDMTKDVNTSVTLKDLLEKPQDLRVKMATDAKLTWAMKSKNIFDDFEEAFVDPVASHFWYMGEYAGSTGWTYLNADGKNTTPNLIVTGKNAFITANLYATLPPVTTRHKVYPYSGDKVVMSNCVEEVAGGENLTDHYMFSPRLNFDKDFTLSFMARTYIFNFYGEHVRIGYSTTDTNPASFTIIAEEDVQNMTWRGFEYEIPKEAHYVMINHNGKCETTLIVDDVFIGVDDDEYNDLANVPARSASYEVYKNGVKLGTTTDNEYSIPGLVVGEACTLGVKAIYSTGTSEMAVLEYTGTSINNITSSALSIYPNPVKDWLTINLDSGIGEVKLFNLSGMVVLHENVGDVNSAKINVAHLPDGLYILTVTNGNQTLKCKVTIKK